MATTIKTAQNAEGAEGFDDSFLSTKYGSKIRG